MNAHRRPIKVELHTCNSSTPTVHEPIALVYIRLAQFNRGGVMNVLPLLFLLACNKLLVENQ